MTDMDRETLERLLSPADLAAPVPPVVRDAAGDVRAARFVAKMLDERRRNAEKYDRLLAEFDDVA